MIYANRIPVLYKFYTLDNYLEDVAEAMNFEPSKRGAAVTKAKRSYKQSVVIGCLIDVSIKESLDITPTLANQLARNWTGKGIKREVLNQLFSLPGRSAKNKSQDFKRLDELTDKYQVFVQKSLFETVKI